MEQYNNDNIYKWNYTSIMKELLSMDTSDTPSNQSGGYTSKDVKENILTGGNIETNEEVHNDDTITVNIDEQVTNNNPDQLFTGGDLVIDTPEVTTITESVNNNDIELNNNKDPVDVITDILLRDNDDADNSNPDNYNIPPENEYEEEEDIPVSEIIEDDDLDIDHWLANLKNTFENNRNTLYIDGSKPETFTGGYRDNVTITNRFPYII